MRRQISCEAHGGALGRAHDVVGPGVERRAHRLELRRRAVGELKRRHPFARRRLLHLLAVLVHAGEEQDVVAVEPFEPRDRIGRDPLIGMADMRRAIGIGNGGGDVEGRAPAIGAFSKLDGGGRATAGASGAAASAAREFGEKGQDEGPLVEIESLGLPRGFGGFFPYLGQRRKARGPAPRLASQRLVDPIDDGGHHPVASGRRSRPASGQRGHGRRASRRAGRPDSSART